MKCQMHISPWVAAVLTAAVAIAQESDKESTIIPLDQIWAYKMPGAREIEEIARPADMRQMGSVLESWFVRAEILNFKNLARPGLAVSGNGAEALRAAFSFFAGEEKPRQEFSSDDEITIVFFSEPASRYRVQIQQVERTKDAIDIRYWLEPEMGSRRTNFALIPLGKIPVGKYDVTMHQVEIELTAIETELGFKAADEAWSRDYLCKPFSIVVNEKQR